MNIVVGISGGIAAYKSPDLVRRLKEQGAEVRVVMTAGAEQFITAMSLQAVSGNPVACELFDLEAEAAMGHIELAKWADKIIIAPATADLIARLASGMANDLLTTICLATTAPVSIAPAMNQQMWAHPATAANIETLKARGVTILGPGSGEQACGDVGLGRMLEPEQLAKTFYSEEQVSEARSEQRLTGKKVLITAGPTREAIDPVRYLTNQSSGKMGFALAEAAKQAGAEVTLIAGPVNLDTPSGVKRIDVVSAQQMFDAVHSHLTDIDLFIGTAAVADYRVAEQASQKIKKQDQQLVLTMVENPDIIASVASQPNKPWCVGFAAETEQMSDYAQAKLQAKGLDMICANDVSDKAIGFDSDHNAVTLYTRDGTVTELEKASKATIAKQIIEQVAQQINQ